MPIEGTPTVALFGVHRDLDWFVLAVSQAGPGRWVRFDPVTGAVVTLMVSHGLPDSCVTRPDFALLHAPKACSRHPRRARTDVTSRVALEHPLGGSQAS